MKEQRGSRGMPILFLEPRRQMGVGFNATPVCTGVENLTTKCIRSMDR
jgi:hypothetical protein